MKNKLRTRRSADLYAEFQRRLRSSDAAKNGAASLREIAADADAQYDGGAGVGAGGTN